VVNCNVWANIQHCQCWGSVISIQYSICIDRWSCRHVMITYTTLCTQYMVLAWLSVWSEMQMICNWSSWCHCHPIISCSGKIQNGLPFWFRLTKFVLEKRPLNGCSSSTWKTVWLWLPCVANADIIFSSCFFFFFSSPNLNGCRLDVYHTSTHGP